MRRVVAEFEEQSFIQIIFPHENTDWIKYLQDAQECFVNIINAIIKYQPCLVICKDITKVKKMLPENSRLFFVEYSTNDTWARDCSALSVEIEKQLQLLDFTFNGWGGKFEASKDDAMSMALSQHYSVPLRHIDFILEGGGIESNGDGLLLSTAKCIFNANRNYTLNKAQIIQELKNHLGAKKVLCLKHGYLAGDDTDSHIDTLARFTGSKTIMYVQCLNKEDEHYRELQLMQRELQSIASKYDLTLIALPMTDPIYFKGERLPATYANFLFINNAVLVPIYGVLQDKEALSIFKKTFPKRDIIPINCATLIKQHGSLHCASMNFAKGIKIIL